MTDVGAVHHDDARISPQGPGELAVADIYRIDTRRAAPQQHVCEAARGRANVQTDAAAGIEPKDVERAFELEAATTGVA